MTLRPVLALILVAGTVPTVGFADATVSATASNAANTFSSTALYAPTSPSAAPLGHTASVSWAASIPQNGNGYVVSGTNVGSSPSATCPPAASSYSFVAGTAAATFTDSTSLAGGTDGTYVCYLLRGGQDPAAPASWVADPAWTSADVLPTVKTAIGFFATGVTLTNVGTAGSINSGDVVAVTFDQAVNTAGLSIAQVCAAVASKTLYLGSSGGGPLSCTTANTAGMLTGINLSSTLSLDGAFAATAAWSNANRTLTITIGAQSMGQPISVGAGTTTYTPAAFSSSAGAAAICTTAICTPTSTTTP
jgi:hypothetical protein